MPATATAPPTVPRLIASAVFVVDAAAGAAVAVEDEDDTFAAAPVELVVLLKVALCTAVRPDATEHWLPVHSMGQVHDNVLATPPLKHWTVLQNCPANGATHAHEVAFSGVPPFR